MIKSCNNPSVDESINVLGDYQQKHNNQNKKNKHSLPYINPNAGDVKTGNALFNHAMGVTSDCCGCDGGSMAEDYLSNDEKREELSVSKALEYMNCCDSLDEDLLVEKKDRKLPKNFSGIAYFDVNGDMINQQVIRGIEQNDVQYYLNNNVKDFTQENKDVHSYMIGANGKILYDSKIADSKNEYTIYKLVGKGFERLKDSDYKAIGINKQMSIEDAAEKVYKYSIDKKRNTDKSQFQIHDSEATIVFDTKNPNKTSFGKQILSQIKSNKQGAENDPNNIIDDDKPHTFLIVLYTQQGKNQKVAGKVQFNSYLDKADETFKKYVKNKLSTLRASNKKNSSISVCAELYDVTAERVRTYVDENSIRYKDNSGTLANGALKVNYKELLKSADNVNSEQQSTPENSSTSDDNANQERHTQQENPSQNQPKKTLKFDAIDWDTITKDSPEWQQLDLNSIDYKNVNEDNYDWTKAPWDITMKFKLNQAEAEKSVTFGKGIAVDGKASKDDIYKFTKYKNEHEVEKESHFAEYAKYVSDMLNYIVGK